MENMVGVRFRTVKKICYFEGQSTNYAVNDGVICQTVHGLEFGNVCYVGKKVENAEIQEEYIILRKANQKDIEQNKDNLKFEEEAFNVTEECIRKFGLNMNLVRVVAAFDRLKILFFFTSSERVDFRALVKRLAYLFHARVELKQIGIRDEAKMISGMGICGRPFCCSTFLCDFNHVSIKMAKEQNLSLNPKKISGCCGKLMCCLSYEKNAYDFLNKVSPKIGAVVMSPDGEGVVVNGNPLTGKYRVKLKSSSDVERVFNKDSLKLIKNGCAKKGKSFKQ